MRLIIKAKYTRKYQGPKGNWIYKYDDGKKRKSRAQGELIGSAILAGDTLELRKQGGNQYSLIFKDKVVVRGSKAEISKELNTGYFSTYPISFKNLLHKPAREVTKACSSESPIKKRKKKKKKKSMVELPDGSGVMVGTVG